MVNYATMLETFKAELTQTEKFKRDMIVKLAKQLEKESDIPVAEINDRVASDLEGYLTRQWVGQCLADKYKNGKKQHKEKKSKKEKEKLIEVAADGTQLPNYEEEQHAKFHQDLGKALEERSAQSANLNDIVVKELDQKQEQLKELESKLQNVITPDQFKELENKLSQQNAIIDELRNYVGEWVVYDKDLQVEHVRPRSRDEKIKISLRKFEDEIKESFQQGKQFAYIEHDGAIVTDWK